jgi:VanZ family protein
LTPSSPPAEPSGRRTPRDFALHVLPALVWAVLVVVGGGSHAPEPDIDIGFPIDKLEHAVAFLVMQLLAFRALRHEFPERSPARLALAAALAAILVGIGLELYQLGLPHRSAEFADVVADSVGAGIGALLVGRRA